MKIITLAAGQGTRLRPFTNEIPKCLVKFKNKSIYQYQLDIFNHFKIKKKFIVTGYKNNQIKFKSVKNIYNSIYKNSNMVYSLFLALDLFDGKEDLIVSYGDIIFCENVFEELLKSNYDFTVVSDKGWQNYWKLRMNNYWNDIESFSLNNNGNIISIGQNWKNKSEIEGQYIGLFKISKNIQKDIKKRIMDIMQDKKNYNIYMTDFLQSLVGSTIVLKPMFIINGWLEFDTPEDLNPAFSKFLY